MRRFLCIRKATSFPFIFPTIYITSTRQTEKTPLCFPQRGVLFHFTAGTVDLSSAAILSPISSALYRYYHMYRRFTNPKLLSSFPHCRAVFDNILGEANRPILRQTFQSAPSPLAEFLLSSYAGGKWKMTSGQEKRQGRKFLCNLIRVYLNAVACLPH